MDVGRAEPNLTPILDMVFQLITFFLLVINFRTTDFNKDLDLPVVGSAAPVDEQLDRELLVLNLRADGSLVSRGKPQPWIKTFLTNEMKGFQIAMKSRKEVELPVTVVIRADRSLTFGPLNEVVEVCKLVGFKQFAFIVMRDNDESLGPN